MEAEVYTLVMGIVAFSGWIGTILYAKYSMNDDRILDKLDNLTDKMLKDEAFVKKLYLIGALVGQGIGNGIGIKKQGGKFNLENIIASIAGQVAPGLINKFLGGGGEAVAPASEGFPFGQTS